ncbi:MAG: flagellar basal body P-ring formation chaperone FlgA [Nitrospiraceae bacterium]|nr:flagellar basal body P-ring formation chaperone FlgA [Nitrospiraceae bacterium]
MKKVFKVAASRLRSLDYGRFSPCRTLFGSDLLKLQGFFFIAVSLFAFHYPLCSASAGSENIGGVLKDYIKSNYPWDEVDLSDLKLSSDPPSGVPQQILVEKRLPGRALFVLEYKNGSRIVATAQVKAFDRIVASGNSFRKGHYLREGDLYMTAVEVGRIPKGAVREIGKASGKVLTRSIIANMPVVENMVAEKPEVKKGQRVMIVAESKGFSITTFGEMKENGYVGRYAKAFNQTSKKTVTGLLVDENTIRVEF